MTLVDGVHHITFLTDDMDRLLAFYVRVFDAEATLDMTEEGVRHAFLKVGATTVLHPFQMLEGPGPPSPSPMYSRGRLDHFALLAPSEESFRELRRRSEAEGAADGDVRDMRELLDHGLLRPRRSCARGDAGAARLHRLGDARTGGVDHGYAGRRISAMSFATSGGHNVLTRKPEARGG